MTTLLFLLLACAALAEAGYYKIRPPHPPPPPPPGSLYYGHYPPQHYPSRHYPPPPHSHPHYHRGPHHRLYHQRYPKPPLPPYQPWKSGSGYGPSFNSPPVKETFNIPQGLYTPAFTKEEDKGPIHTIPAPNLGPANRPHLFQPEGFNDGSKKPLEGTQEDLQAILRHGITKVNVPPSHGYQVTEDPAASTLLNIGHPSYFAPDPDPHVPSLKIPPTNDPHSLPSNGQVPLDLYLQQQAESHSQYGSYQRPAEQSNSLTPQELFNLLNYQQPSTASLQQQVQLLLPQAGQHYQQELVQHQFAQPQYQTFNYEEQGQQGLRLDLQTKGFNDIANHRDLLEDNDVAGSNKEETFEHVVKNELAQQQRHESKNIIKEKGNLNDNAKVQLPKKYSTESEVYHPNLIVTSNVNDKHILRDQKQETSAVQRGNIGVDNTNSQTMTSAKPENNVQLQKSIQIYENTYANNDDLAKQEIKNINDFNDYADEEKVVRGTVVGSEGEKHFENSENVHIVDAVPYGSRIRPKRF